jgi:hypothetical protein
MKGSNENHLQVSRVVKARVSSAPGQRTARPPGGPAQRHQVGHSRAPTQRPLFDLKTHRVCLHAQTINPFFFFKCCNRYITICITRDDTRSRPGQSEISQYTVHSQEVNNEINKELTGSKHFHCMPEMIFKYVCVCVCV